MAYSAQLSANMTTSHVQLPVFNPDHLCNLTDTTGMIQHALRTFPNRKEGYCIDDNSRALLLAAIACKQDKYPEMLKLMHTYLSFVHYMQREDGYFDNFLTYNKTILPNDNSEDAYGRTLLALGYLTCYGPNIQFIRTAEELFLKAYPHVHRLISLRGIANSLIGVCHFICYNNTDQHKKDVVISLADKLSAEYIRYSDGDWKWFEDILAYDNAMIPLALLHAYKITHYTSYLRIALESISFLETKVFRDGVLYPVGNNGWSRKGEGTALFDQQPLDAMAMVLCYQQAHYATGNNLFLSKMQASFEWFLGKNALNLSLYDEQTGGCADGLQTDRVNENQGAESTIAYWISYFAIRETFHGR
jgi:hypothetical protein